MKPVHLAGRGLACSLGTDVRQALNTVRSQTYSPGRCIFPGAPDGFPYYAIPFKAANWDERARSLIQRVAAEADAGHARQGALFVASSSLNIGAVEQGSALLMAICEFSGMIAGWLDWAGPVHMINTACTSSMNALLAAHAMLRKGEMDDALVLGLELENRTTLGGFAGLQLLSPTGCQPFGANRDGLVLGEAVAALRLSTRDAAEWQILGGANVVDGSQPTSASISAIEAMCSGAFAASGCKPDSIDLIKVQAAGSPGNDAVEAEALHRCFSPMPALVSLKTAMGHTMGASGAAEIALLTACLEQNIWPGQASDADTALGVQLSAHPPQQVRRALAMILGFGGSHSAVVLERNQQ